MGATASKFAVELGGFLSKVEGAVPTVAKLHEKYKKRLKSKQTDLQRYKGVVEKLDGEIEEYKKHVDNAVMFGSSLQRTIHLVSQYLPLLSEQEQRLLRQRSSVDEQKGDAPLKPPQKHIRFRDMYAVTVTKTRSMLGLSLENDAFGLRIAEIEEELLNGLAYFAIPPR